MDNKKIKEQQQQLLKEVDFLAVNFSQNERKNKNSSSSYFKNNQGK